MAGGFGCKVHHALKLDAGSSSEFQQATITFKCLRSTLQEIVHGLQNADPSFRNAIRGQLDLSINSIAGFNTRLQDDYGEQLGVSALKGKHRGTLRKIKWAFSAAEDIAKFRIELSRQLEIVKLLIVSETNTKVSDIAVEVTANQEVLGTIKQQYPLLLSEAQKTRTSVKQPLSVIQEYCCTSTHLLHGIQDDYRGFSQSVGTGLQILQDQGKQKALDIAGLTANMSALSTEARQGCSERSTAHTKAALKQDMTLAAIQELCTLVVDLKNQQTGSISRSDTQQVNQYQLIQRYINEIGESAQDSATSPTSITDDTLRGLRQSRNSMTQRLISAIDGVNTTLVMSPSKFMGILQACYNRLLLFSPAIQHSLGLIQFLALRPYHKLAGNYIRFEDFLGDVCWLDTSCFLHFRVLDEHIRHRYTKGPAQYKVERNEYRISTVGNPSIAVTEANWSQITSTGPQLRMSAVAKTLSWDHCPSCFRPFPDISPKTSHFCTHCSQSCYIHDGSTLEDDRKLGVAQTADRLDTYPSVKDCVDVDLKVFKHLSAILHKSSSPLQGPLSISQRLADALAIQSVYLEMNLVAQANTNDRERRNTRRGLEEQYAFSTGQ